jgi:uncharacterized membrane protein
MAFCKNCGSAVEGQFCAKCGTPVAAPAGPAYTAPPPPPPSQPYAQAGPGVPPPAPAAAGAGMADNVAGLLCYIFGLVSGVLFLVIEPYNKNKFVRFHAFQSIFLNVAVIALSIVFGIFSGIMLAALPWSVWWLWHLVTTVVWLAFLALWVVMMVKAYQGQRFKLPIIGDLAEKQA